MWVIFNLVQQSRILFHQGRITSILYKNDMKYLFSEKIPSTPCLFEQNSNPVYVKLKWIYHKISLNYITVVQLRYLGKMFEIFFTLIP